MSWWHSGKYSSSSSGILRGQSDKYLSLPPVRASIEKEIHYRVVHSLLDVDTLKFKQNRIRGFVLAAYKSR